jgi:predicted NACHT family NTPase
LLGEPGLGKSRSLEAKYQTVSERVKSTGDDAQWFDLRSYADEGRLVLELFESEFYLSWLEGSHHLHLFIDSLDESRLRIKTITGLLVDKFKHHPLERLSLRSACRTAEWSDFLETELKERLGEDKVKVYELEPLRRQDVAGAVQAEGMDAEAFLSEVARKEAQSLAARPLTLRFLLNFYKKNTSLPKTRRELYLEGCRLLCDEPNLSRLDSGLTGVLTAEQRLVVAGRIASVTVFANRAAIKIGADQNDTSDEDVAVRELSGGGEQIADGLQFEVTEDGVKETLGYGLFSARGTVRRGWSHQTYGEFLAAWYLQHNKLTSSQIVNLLTASDDASAKIIPQLYETAAWAASMSSEVFREIMRRDATVLLRSDVASADRELKSALVAALLEMFAEERARDGWEFRSHYRKLKHPHLADQLEHVVVDKEKAFLVRRVAIDIAQECELCELQAELASIALDASDHLSVRLQAADAAGSIGDNDTRARLKPLALGLVGPDPDNELRGYGLIAVHPEHITAEELFDHLKPPPRERIARLLDRFEAGDLTAWWQLNMELTLEPHSTHYGSELVSELTALPGWHAADAQTRSRIIGAAKNYVLEGDPETSQWVGTNVIHRPAWAGYRALQLLLQVERAFVEALSSEVWHKWAPIIFAYPTSSGIEAEREAPHRVLNALAYRHAPDLIIESLLATLDKVNSEDGYFSIPDKLDDAWDARLENALLAKAQEPVLKPVYLGQVLNKLLERRGEGAKRFAESLVTLPFPTEEDSRERAIVAARELVSHAEDAGWPVVWAAIMEDAAFGRSVIESLSGLYEYCNISERLGEGELADLYIWMEREYPHATDPIHEGVHSVGVRESVDGRDKLAAECSKAQVFIPRFIWKRLRVSSAKILPSISKDCSSRILARTYAIAWRMD